MVSARLVPEWVSEGGTLILRVASRRDPRATLIDLVRLSSDNLFNLDAQVFNQAGFARFDVKAEQRLGI